MDLLKTIDTIENNPKLKQRQLDMVRDTLGGEFETKKIKVRDSEYDVSLEDCEFLLIKPEKNDMNYKILRDKICQKVGIKHYNDKKIIDDVYLRGMTRQEIKDLHYGKEGKKAETILRNFQEGAKKLYGNQFDLKD